MKTFFVLCLILMMAPAEASTRCRELVERQGGPLLHANGKILTYSSGVSGATWSHSNGKVMTYSALVNGVPTYHSNGKILSYSTGISGVPWYHANGKLLSPSMGVPGSILLNDNGTPVGFVSSSMDSDDLWLEACEIGFNG